MCDIKIKEEIKEEILSDLELEHSPGPFQLNSDDEPFQYDVADTESSDDDNLEEDSKSLCKYFFFWKHNSKRICDVKWEVQQTPIPSPLRNKIIFFNFIKIVFFFDFQ